MADDTDRVLMKAKSTFNNPLITVKQKPLKEGELARQLDEHTVDVDDEFSTSEAHAVMLEQGGLAERTGGAAEPISDRAAALVGAQTPAGGAIATNRASTEKPIAPAKTDLKA